MKFIPKQLSRNHNVSDTHPLVEFLWLAGGLVAVSAIFFFVLGIITDIAVEKIPLRLENWLGRHALQKVSADNNVYLQGLLQELLAELPEDSPLRERAFTVYVSKNPSINAIALPGGNIIVYTGLLENTNSENELVMVLGHELGHYAHKDHLRGLGRGLGITVGTLLLFGQDSATSELVSNSLLSFQGKYSRGQEAAADTYGLEALVRHYGHAGGATDFFTRLAARGHGNSSYLHGSHPQPGDRVNAMKREIARLGYQVYKTAELPKQVWKKTDG